MDSNITGVAHISVFPAKGFHHSSEGDISALAGYLNSLLADFPQDSGFKHSVLTNIKGSAPCHFDLTHSEVIECWRRGSLSFFLDLIRMVHKNPRWRIIHLQHEFNQFGGALALPLTLLMLGCFRVFMGRKVVVTVHEVLRLELLTRSFLDSVFVKYPVLLTRLVVFLYYFLLGRCANILIAQDEVFAAVLKDQYKVRANVRIVRIGTSIAKPADPTTARSRWLLPRKGRVVLFFGTIDWRKGIDQLLDSWLMLPADFGTLLLAGGTPTRVAGTAEYQSWRKSVENRARSIPSTQFIGFVEDCDLAKLFGAADVIVLPYIVPQRVSAVFNQAASFGKPLLASSVFQGQADPCVLFEPTAEAIAEKLAWAFDGHMPLLEAASLKFRENHCWRSSSFQLCLIYRELLIKK